MIETPEFIWDDEANGYLSDEVAISDPVTVCLELAERAPVVTLKQEKDGGFANYGQSPQQSDHYKIHIRATQPAVIKLATPVAVKKCYILIHDKV